MSQINLKSIIGITSITTPAGADNQLTVHSNDTTERFKIDSSGNVTATSFIGNGANLTGIDATSLKDPAGYIKIQAQDSGAVYTGIHTFSSSIDIGSNIKIGNAGVVTATSYSGSGASLTNLNASNIASGTVPTARLGSGTANSSTFLAGDSTFKTVTGTTINNNADNRVITGSGTANTLEGEANLTFDGGHLILGNGKGIRANYIRPTTMGNTNTGGAAQQYWKLGEISLNGSEAAEITLLGANGYSAGNTQVYGKTTIILRGSNGNTLLGSWWVEGGQGGHYQDVRWKHISGTNYELWVSAGNFNNIAPFVKATGTFDQTNAAGTGSNTAPSGSTALPQTHYKTVGSINTIEYTNTHTRYLRNIKMDSGYGIDFSATSDSSNGTMSSELLDDYEEGLWVPLIRNTSGSGTYGGSNVGSYTKIGNMVHISGTIHWTAMSGTTNWAGVIRNLPFASYSGTGFYRSACVVGATSGLTPNNSGSPHLVFIMDAGQGFLYIVGANVTSSGFTHYPTISNAGSVYGFDLSYRVA